MDFTTLKNTMEAIAEKELKRTNGKTAFEDLRIPCRWFAATGNGQPLMRCINDHVSEFGLQTEEHGLICLECFEPVVWTFPEDKEGPLKT